jgi:hypothetical protein
MFNKLLTLIFLLFVSFRLFSQVTPFEKDKLTTTTYQECIDYYFELASKSDMLKIIEYGETDIGKPLHLVIVSKNKIFDPVEIKKSGKVILFVNNGIHAGEPDGIDASMMFVRDLVKGKVMNPFSGLPFENLLDNVVLITIPVYNIGGFLNRNNFTRANQIGPKEYGFRGNAQNRDLNRDFIKCDTKNAMSFIKIFQEWKPELFVDTHTTDGADYKYTMTYIATNRFKLEQPLSDYLTNDLIPFLNQDMNKKHLPVCPYVEPVHTSPDSGLGGFMDYGRYSNGYASLFNTIGFISESHMLKTHAERVYATYEFLVSLIKKANDDCSKIIGNKKKADENSIVKNEFEIKWQNDESKYSTFMFEGYEAKYKKSTVTGFDRLYYDKNAPYKKEIKIFDFYNADVTVTKPIAYVVPQGWFRVIELLKLNNVQMKRLSKDCYIEVESYFIDTFSTRSKPYEGHYQHSNVSVNSVMQTRYFFEGDYVVNTNQTCNNFIVNVLEPQAADSYFNWNFFDAILQQKENFDTYLFEDIADSLLNSKPELKELFKMKKREDEKFSKDPNAQLTFIYNNTILEPEYMRYPVARMIKEKVIETK